MLILSIKLNCKTVCKVECATSCNILFGGMNGDRFTVLWVTVSELSATLYRSDGESRLPKICEMS